MAKKGGKNDSTKGNNICNDVMGAFYVLGIKKKDSVATTQLARRRMICLEAGAVDCGHNI